MADKVSKEGAEYSDAPLKEWSASSSPAQRVREQAFLGSSKLQIEEEQEGRLFAVLRFFARSKVKLVLALALFIAAALVWEFTINQTTWSEKQDAPKPLYGG